MNIHPENLPPQVFRELAILAAADDAGLPYEEVENLTPNTYAKEPQSSTNEGSYQKKQKKIL